MTLVRPLRSVLIGDVDYYPSEFALGVNQAMTCAGHWHATVNVRADMGTIAVKLDQVRPDVIWGHMLLWAPRGADGESKTPDLLQTCANWRARYGTRVLLHDGDAREDTRFPTDVSPAVDVALCNHAADRSAWKVRQLRWPYFAFDQSAIAAPHPDFACDLAFAGRLDGGGRYAARTDLVLRLKARLGDRMRVFPGSDVAHTLFLTPTIAASAKAVLGYGRPESPGWLDVRAFQYPGAGGVLLYDDQAGLGDLPNPLVAWEHYLPYKPGDAEDVGRLVDAVLGVAGYAWRLRAFRYVQEYHSATARVREALAAVGLNL